MYQNFSSCVRNRLKDMVHYALEKRKKMPSWMGETIWEQLIVKRSTPEFLQISEKSRRNRSCSSSEFGSSLHCGGSIPATEHARLLVFFFFNFS